MNLFSEIFWSKKENENNNNDKKNLFGHVV